MPETRYFASTLAPLLILGLLSATALGADLSRYRDFQLGMGVPAVEKQIGANSPQTQVVSARPVLIQELEWRPRSLGWTAKTEPVQSIVFGFLAGELFRISVIYDRSETEGLTSEDMVEAISSTYGKAEPSSATASVVLGPYGERGDVIGRWEDPRYRFDLVRLSHGPTYKLIAVTKKLEGAFESATLEAKRIEEQEAPRREAARLAGEEETAKTRLEKARVVNKPKFRP
jgi:hypothetical protein